MAQYGSEVGWEKFERTGSPALGSDQIPLSGMPVFISVYIDWQACLNLNVHDSGGSPVTLRQRLQSFQFISVSFGGVNSCVTCLRSDQPFRVVIRYEIIATQPDRFAIFAVFFFPINVLYLLHLEVYKFKGRLSNYICLWITKNIYGRLPRAGCIDDKISNSRLKRNIGVKARNSQSLMPKIRNL